MGIGSAKNKNKDTDNHYRIDDLKPRLDRITQWLTQNVPEYQNGDGIENAKLWKQEPPPIADSPTDGNNVHSECDAEEKETRKDHELLVESCRLAQVIPQGLQVPTKREK